MGYVLRMGSVFERVPLAAEKPVPSEAVGCSILCQSDVTVSVSNNVPILHQDNQPLQTLPIPH